MAKKRDFLAISDFSRDDLTQLLERACSLKSGVDRAQLTGKTLAMIFRKSSTRTRVSFQVGMSQLGGHAIFLSDSDSQIGRGESVHDTAKVLSRYVDGIMIRTFAHAEVEEFARHASVPVINGLTDLLHPCQIIADLQTMAEEFGREHAARTVAWIGDGNNMANSWLNAAYRLGFSLRLACPEGYDPEPELLARAQCEADVVLTRDRSEAVQGADVVTTDVWASIRFWWTSPSWARRRRRRSSSTACPPTAGRKSPRASSTDPSHASSTKPRIVCTRRKRSCWS